MGATHSPRSRRYGKKFIRSFYIPASAGMFLSMDDRRSSEGAEHGRHIGEIAPGLFCREELVALVGKCALACGRRAFRCLFEIE